MANNTITKAALIVTALAICHPVHAQLYPYSQGYRDGYNDHYPMSGVPDSSTEYGRGWHAGQDDSYDDDEMMYRSIQRDYDYSRPVLVPWRLSPR